MTGIVRRSQSTDHRQKKILPWTMDRGLWTKQGFTLLELLAAIFMISIVGTVALTLFSKGIGIWEDVRFRSSTEYETILFLEGLEKEARNYVNFSEIGFSGKSETIRFPAFINVQRENSDHIQNVLGCINYRFDRDKMAVYKSKISYPESTQESSSAFYRVLKRVKSLNFEYGVLDKQEEFKWSSLWKKEGGIPEAVRIRIEVGIDEEFRNTCEFERTFYIPII